MQQYTKCIVGNCGKSIECRNLNNPRLRRVVCDDCVAFFTPYVSRGKRNAYNSQFRAVAIAMVNKAKDRNKVEVTIDHNYVLSIWPTDNRCTMMGTMMKTAKGIYASRSASPSLDRIDHTKGYIPGNVAVVSTLANRIKSNATAEEMLELAKWINKTYSKE